jgi:integrase
MAELVKEDGVATAALRFLILTASRTSEAIGARWSEIDLPEAVWTVPAGRMKAEREHRVPLSEAALDVLREMGELQRHPPVNAFVFPGAKAGKPLSSMALLMLLQQMKREEPQ